jgi:putative ABC transport system permease protein
MLKNYIKIAFRNVLRNRSNTFINVLGLSIGIAACLLIFLLIRFEKSYDTFHKNKDRIYRLVSVFKYSTGTRYSGAVPFPVADGLRLEYTSLEKVASIYQAYGQVTLLDGKNKGEKFEEENGVFYAEPQFFDLFNFGWLQGDQKSALTEPNSVALTKEYAEKFYGSWQNAIGKTIEFNNEYIFKVTGILRDVPENTDFPLKVVFSYSSLKQTPIKRTLTDWVTTYANYNCYVLFPTGLNADSFDTFLTTFVKNHKPPEYQKEEIRVQPLSDIHFDSRFDNFSHNVFSRELITVLTLIGIFLLIIACVNFINLSTARAINRSREVGVRKVLGSSRQQLALQFISETFLITLFAMLLAIVISETVVKYLNELLKLNLSINIFSDPELIVLLLFLTFAITILSGFYPALVISGFNPVSVLKNKITIKTIGGISLRRGLVILQFAIAQIMIIAMLVVVSQMNYFKNAPLGFDKDSIVQVSFPEDSVSVSKAPTLKNRLLQISGIKNVSLSAFSPIDDSHWNSDFNFDNSPAPTDFNADLKWADADYFKTYNLQFVAGMPFRESDSVKGFVVNESLVRKLGFNDPLRILGKKVNLWDGQIVAPIVGVVKDFHSSPLNKKINPVLIGSWKDVYDMANIKVSMADLSSTMQKIKKIWDSTYPKFIYKYTFLDDKINDFYKNEATLSVLYSIFAGIAIFISCLGLYGLVSFMTIQRTKEVGIRKVLGASAGNIVYLFSREFTLMIIIAFILASPIAYYIMQNWLDKFAYRINLGFGIFLATIVASLLVAWLSVGYRALKAANTNPVNSLRYE